jgi:hypothetical protein
VIPESVVPRRSEAGQGLALALLALFLASLAASLVAMDLGLREQARREEATRAHLRQMLDGALAEALYRLAVAEAVGESLPWPVPARVAASSGARVERRPNRADVWVWATWGGRWGGAHADVALEPGLPPRVLAWRRLPASTAARLRD